MADDYTDWHKDNGNQGNPLGLTFLEALYAGGGGDPRADVVVGYVNTKYPVVGYTSCPAAPPDDYSSVANDAASMVTLDGEEETQLYQYVQARHKAAEISYAAVCSVTPPKAPPPKAPPPKAPPKAPPPKAPPKAPPYQPPPPATVKKGGAGIGLAIVIGLGLAYAATR
jgi:hypothetical protein